MRYRNNGLNKLITMILSSLLIVGMTGIPCVYAEEEPEEPAVSETTEEIADSEEEITAEIPSEELSLPETETIIEQTAEETVPEDDETETEEVFEETVSVSEEAALYNVSTWEALQEVFNSGGQAVLTDNIIASESDTPLVVPENKSIILDLKGFEINRHLTEQTIDGDVIDVKGKLTIDDTSAEGTGKITGGNNGSRDEGGGITVHPEGTLILLNGSICGNHADEYEEFTGSGGGVLVYGGKFEMKGGSVRNNSAGSCGGICIFAGEGFLTGGEISGNEAIGSSGAVGGKVDGIIHIGSAVITGNHAGKYGGAIHVTSSSLLYLSGSPVIENNTAAEGGDNFYLNASYINIEDAFDPDARIRVDFWRKPLNLSNPIDIGTCPYNCGISPESFIFPDSDEYEIRILDGNEIQRIYLYEKPVIVTYDSNNGSGKTLEDEVQRNSTYTLRSNTFAAPQGYVFAAWEIDGTEYGPHKPYDVGTEPVNVKAVWTSVWTQLQKKIDQADPGTVITLDNDCIDFDNEGRLTVAADKDITIDLNGHMISRNMSAADSTGGVFEVKGKLTLNDSAGGGIITGGHSSTSGGAIRIDGGTVVLNGGSIANNISEYPGSSRSDGGGISVRSWGSLIMNGGSITGNYCDGYGGGIYCDYTSSVTLNGGSITENRSDVNGGGIYFAYSGGKCYISGSPFIKGNSVSGSESDLYLTYGQKMILTGPLSEDALIGVSTYTAPDAYSPIVITENLLGNGTADNFFASNTRYFIALNDDDEAVVRVPQTLPEFKGHQLVLSGTLGLKFGMVFPEGFDDTDSYMTFRINDEEQTVYTRDAEEKDGRKIYTCYLNTLQMAERIEATFYYGNGNGVYQNYTLTQYFQYFDNHEASFNEKTLNLVHAVADYGYYAYPYLVRLHNLGSKYAQITHHYAESFDYDEIKQAVADYTFVKNLGSSAVTDASYKLSLDADTALSIMMKVSGGTQSLTGYAKLGDSTYGISKESDTLFIVKVPGIKASQLGDTVQVSGMTVSGSPPEGKSFTITVSALSYVRSVLNSTRYSTDAKNTVAALYKYYEAVKAYTN